MPNARSARPRSGHQIGQLTFAIREIKELPCNLWVAGEATIDECARGVPSANCLLVGHVIIESRQGVQRVQLLCWRPLSSSAPRAMHSAQIAMDSLKESTRPPRGVCALGRLRRAVSQWSRAAAARRAPVQDSSGKFEQSSSRLFQRSFVVLREKQSRVPVVAIAPVCQLADLAERL